MYCHSYILSECRDGADYSARAHVPNALVVAFKIIFFPKQSPINLLKSVMQTISHACNAQFKGFARGVTEAMLVVSFP